ncbi:MAG: TIGR02996 domain-containing protein [Gemmataceae bacterium]
MNEDIGLLADIVENPLDDTPRLIYADWLLDRGEPNDIVRAEFIRLQIDQARQRANPQAARRAKRLLANNARRWSRGLKPLLRASAWRRGFVESASVHAADFLELAHEVLSLAPIRFLHFRQPAGHFASLCRCPHLARLDGFSVQGGSLSSQDLDALGTSPFLETLQVLHLDDNHLGTVRRLRDWFRCMPALTSLSLQNVQLDDVTLGRLAHFLTPRLRQLHLGHNNLTDAGLSVLHGLDLSALALGGNNLSADAINRLLESLPHLQWLQLGPQPQHLRQQLRKDYPSLTLEFRFSTELPE